MALDALAVLGAEQSLLEALAVFLDAEGLAAGTAFKRLDAIHAHDLQQGAGAVAFVGLVVFGVLLVMTVGAAAEAVAFLSRREALAVQFHALRVAAVAVLFLEGLVCLIQRIHQFLFLNLNKNLFQYQANRITSLSLGKQ